MSDNDNSEREKKKETRIGNYLIGNTIGEGAFGKVKQANHVQTNEKVAIKILNKQRIHEMSGDINKIQKEITILKKLRHKSIIQLYEIMESKQNLFLIMEFCPKGELFDYIVKCKKLSELNACRLFQNLIDGVDYLHLNNIVHRDLKPENLLLDDKFNLKISDFGLSTIYSGLISTPCGTPSYAPPEMLKGDSYNGIKSDVWSCGIILYAMLCGYLPYSDSKEEIILRRITNKEYKIPDFLSSKAKDLLVRMLDNDPNKRIDLKEIKSHAWFKLTESSLAPGLFIGVTNIPVDEIIVNKVIDLNNGLKGDLRLNINKEDLINKIKENKFDSITAFYYLLLKKHICQGGVSIADLQSKVYLNYMKNPSNVFDSSDIICADNEVKGDSKITFSPKKLKEQAPNKNQIGTLSTKATVQTENSQSQGNNSIIEQTQTQTAISNVTTKKQKKVSITIEDINKNKKNNSPNKLNFQINLQSNQAPLDKIDIQLKNSKSQSSQKNIPNISSLKEKDKLSLRTDNNIDNKNKTTVIINPNPNPSQKENQNQSSKNINKVNPIENTSKSQEITIKKTSDYKIPSNNSNTNSNIVNTLSSGSIKKSGRKKKTSIINNILNDKPKNDAKVIIVDSNKDKFVSQKSNEKLTNEQLNPSKQISSSTDFTHINNNENNITITQVQVNNQQKPTTSKFSRRQSEKKSKYSNRLDELRNQFTSSKLNNDGNIVNNSNNGNNNEILNIIDNINQKYDDFLTNKNKESIFRNVPNKKIDSKPAEQNKVQNKSQNKNLNLNKSKTKNISTPNLNLTLGNKEKEKENEREINRQSSKVSIHYMVKQKKKNNFTKHESRRLYNNNIERKKSFTSRNAVIKKNERMFNDISAIYKSDIDCDSSFDNSVINSPSPFRRRQSRKQSIRGSFINTSEINLNIENEDESDNERTSPKVGFVKIQKGKINISNMNEDVKDFDKKNKINMNNQTNSYINKNNNQNISQKDGKIIFSHIKNNNTGSNKEKDDKKKPKNQILSPKSTINTTNNKKDTKYTLKPNKDDVIKLY